MSGNLTDCKIVVLALQRSEYVGLGELLDERAFSGEHVHEHDLSFLRVEAHVVREALVNSHAVLQHGFTNDFLDDLVAPEVSVGLLGHVILLILEQTLLEESLVLQEHHAGNVLFEDGAEPFHLLVVNSDEHVDDTALDEDFRDANHVEDFDEPDAFGDVVC